jgi:hypothetical protein
MTLRDGQRITPGGATPNYHGRVQHQEDDPGSDSPDDDSDSDDDDSDSEDGGVTPHVDPRRRRRHHSHYHSMSQRELRYLARDRGLTGSFWEGR